MLTVELVILAGVAVVVVGLLVLAGWFGGRHEGPDPGSEFATWRPVDAEVISMLRAGDRTFLLVRFSVGTSLIQNDVQYPLPGAVPHVGQRVPIMYDPAAPARVVFDLRAPVELGRRATLAG